MNKRKNTIPDHFNNAKEAGEFWYTHSTGDYQDEMEEMEMEFDIQKRTVLVPVDDRIYQCASEQVSKQKQNTVQYSTVTQIINTILNRELLETEQFFSL